MFSNYLLSTTRQVHNELLPHSSYINIIILTLSFPFTPGRTPQDHSLMCNFRLNFLARFQEFSRLSPKQTELYNTPSSSNHAVGWFITQRSLSARCHYSSVIDRRRFRFRFAWWSFAVPVMCRCCYEQEQEAHGDGDGGGGAVHVGDGGVLREIGAGKRDIQ